MKGHEKYIYGLVLSLDKKILFSCSADKTVRVWEIETANCIKIIKDHENEVI